MKKEFWDNKWKDGVLGFHNSDYNSHLLKYWSALEISKARNIFVPLCGKTLDLIWLKDQNLEVTGVELVPKAINEFFSENNLGVSLDEVGGSTVYSTDGIRIFHQDLFKLDSQILENTDLVFDRASMVALPLEMRKDYAKLYKDHLKVGTQILLIVYEYNQELRDGPPFSISDAELSELYSESFSIEKLDTIENTENLSDHNAPWFTKIFKLIKTN